MESFRVYTNTFRIDTLAGQMQALRGGKKVIIDDDDESGSNTEGDDDDYDTSETDTETESDE